MAKKALLNVVSKFLYQFVALITGLIVPRLIIGMFGSSYNGAVSSITQFLSMISVLTLGLAGATRVELYKTLSKKDVLGTSKVVSATAKCFHRIGYALIVYTVFLAALMPFLLKGEILWYDAVLLVFAISVGTFGEYYFGKAYYLLLQADQCEYISTFALIAVKIINVIVTIVLIELNSSLVLVKLGGSILMVLYPLFVYWYAKKRYQLIKCEGDVSVLKQRGSAMFHSIANIVHDNTSVLLLTVFTDAMTISVYSVYYLIVRNIKQVAQNFTTGLEGAFGRMWARGEKDLLKKNFNTFEFLMYSFSSVVFTCTGLLLVSFIALYTKGINDVNYARWGFAVLVTVAEGVFCIRQPYVIIVQAAGKYKETKYGALAEACINLVCSTVFVILFGLNGVIIGMLIANLFRTVQYAIFASRHIIDRSIWSFLKNMVWHIGNTVVIVLLYQLATKGISIETWGSWFICAMIGFAISMAVTGLSAVIFYRKEVKNTWKFVLKVCRRKNKMANA